MIKEMEYMETDATYKLVDKDGRTKIEENKQSINRLTNTVQNNYNELKSYTESAISNNNKTLANRFEEIIVDGYPLIMQACYSEDTTKRYVLQSMACLKDTNYKSGRTTKLCTVTEKDDIENQITIYSRSGENWVMEKQILLTGQNSVGHGNGCAWKNLNEILIASGSETKPQGVIYSVNYQSGTVKPITLGGISVKPTGIGYDSTTDMVWVSYGYEVFGYKYGQWTNFIEKRNIPDITKTTGQDIEVENDLIYKIRSDINLDPTVGSSMKNTALIQVYDKKGQITTMLIDTMNELESIAIDHGYMYMSYNQYGDGMRQCRIHSVEEGIFDYSFYNPYRMGISAQKETDNFKTIDVYYQSSQSASDINYGAGLGSNEVPFNSLLAMAVSLKKIMDRTVHSVNIHIEDNGLASKFDRTLSIIGSNSTVHIKGNGVNNIGCLMVKNCANVDINDCYIAPGATFFTDNSIIKKDNENGACQVSYSAISISGCTFSGNSNYDCFTSKCCNLSLEKTVNKFQNGRVYVTRGQNTVLSTSTFTNSVCNETHCVGEKIKAD